VLATLALQSVTRHQPAEHQAAGTAQPTTILDHEWVVVKTTVLGTDGENHGFGAVASMQGRADN
jgi:hypothetical protein